MIWYKMQPNSEIAAAISDLLTDYCGSIKSHDTTVKPQKIAPLAAEILSCSDALIVVGGMEAMTPEENIVHLISKTLKIPLEQGKRSRSKYVFDTLHGTRLPSFKGAVLFPTRFGGPEGILLLSGPQTVIILPHMTRAAVVAAVSMRKFLAPYVRARRVEAYTSLPEAPAPKDYGKFSRDSTRRRSVTREYSESGLNAVMERAVSYARRRSGLQTYDDWRDDSGRKYRDIEWNDEEEAAYYNRLSQSGKRRNIVSLLLVIGAIVALIAVACLYPNRLF